MTLQIKLISAIFALVVMNIGNIAASFTLCMLGNLLLLLLSADFFQIQLFQNNLSGTL